MPEPPPMSSFPVELLERDSRTSTLQKASRWRGKQGSAFNIARMNLVFNTFAPTLFTLSKSCGPGSNSHVHNVILKGICDIDTSIAQYCHEIAPTVEELWSLGVFHWEDCRAIVLGSAIAVPAPLRMGKNRKKGKKGKKTRKGVQSGQLPWQRRQAKRRQAPGSKWETSRAEKSLAPSMADDQKFQTIPTCSRVQTQIHGKRHSINGPAESDLDAGMMDLSPARADTDIINLLLDEDIIAACTGIDIFKAASSSNKRDGLPASSSSGADTLSMSERSLQDAYADHPDAKLFNLDKQALGLAGKAVKQVVFEATYEFLQKCIPRSDQQKTWDHILESATGKKPEINSIAVPDGSLDLKEGRRPIFHLISNCIKILSQDFTIVDQKDLNLAFNRGIALCDALNDGRKREALESTVHSLNWLMLGLDCKTLDMYRNANQELDRINTSYFTNVEQGAISPEGMCNARNLEERNLLWTMKRSFENFKEPFRVNFVQKLQRLLAEI